MKTGEWGALILGEQADVEAWKRNLPEGGDPKVETVGEDHVLCSSAFKQAETSFQTFKIALPMIDRLNGLVALEGGTIKIWCRGAAKMIPAGLSRHFISLAEPITIEIVQPSQAYAAGSKSISQQRYEAAKQSPHLNTALTYFATADNWVDIYKCIEAMMRQFGGEKAFLAKDWASPEIRRIKQTANALQRHAVGGDHRAPANPPTLAEAKVLLREQLKKAIEASRP